MAIINGGKTWAEAKAYCESQDTKLVNIAQYQQLYRDGKNSFDL